MSRLTDPRCGFVPPTPGYAPCRRLAGHEGPCAHELIDDTLWRLERYGDWQIVARWHVHPLANCTAFATRHTHIARSFAPPVTQTTGFLEAQAGTLDGAISAMKRLIDAL